jgi:hypothetical protein
MRVVGRRPGRETVSLPSTATLSVWTPQCEPCAASPQPCPPSVPQYATMDQDVNAVADLISPASSFGGYIQPWGCRACAWSMGPVSSLLVGSFVRHKLARLFNYRHRVTRTTSPRMVRSEEVSE